MLEWLKNYIEVLQIAIAVVIGAVSWVAWKAFSLWVWLTDMERVMTGDNKTNQPGIIEKINNLETSQASTNSRLDSVEGIAKLTLDSTKENGLAVKGVSEKIDVLIKTGVIKAD